MRTGFIILGSAWLLCGCGAATSEPARSAPPAKAAPASASVKITDGLHAGTSYTTLRRRLLLDGWLPLQSTQCAANTGKAHMCNQWLELQSCSDAGICSVTWAEGSASQTLDIEVQGLARDAAANAMPDTAKVVQWRLQFLADAHASAPAAACPSNDFSTFLPAFAGNEKVRVAFTAPLVRSTVLVSDEGSDRLTPVFVRGDRAEVFNLNYSDGAFHHVSVDGVDPASLTLNIRADGSDGQDVSYVYGSSEGRSFHFTREHGCWYLTGNPQPTGP